LLSLRLSLPLTHSLSSSVNQIHTPHYKFLLLPPSTTATLSDRARKASNLKIESLIKTFLITISTIFIHAASADGKKAAPPRSDKRRRGEKFINE
jgi:hypothetical protein